MREETYGTIKEIADKLGTTTEYLWLILVKQAPISGISDLIVCFVLITSCYLSSKASYKLYDNDKLYENVGTGLASMFTGILILFSIIVISCNLSLIVSALYNPEYWALKQIIK